MLKKMAENSVTDTKAETDENEYCAKQFKKGGTAIAWLQYYLLISFRNFLEEISLLTTFSILDLTPNLHH